MAQHKLNLLLEVLKYSDRCYIISYQGTETNEVPRFVRKRTHAEPNHQFHELYPLATTDKYGNMPGTTPRLK